MHPDTDLGGPAAAFPATHCSLIRAVASPDATVRRQAQETLIAAYWKPVYKYLRIKWRLPNEDAKDLCQAFFAQALEKDFFERFDPSRARFRTFVRLCVDGFVAKEQRAAARLKRGGHVQLLSLDFAGADEELRLQQPAAAANLDDFFRQEWLRSLVVLAVEDLRHQCASTNKDAHFALFERYDLQGAEAGQTISYLQLGQELGLSTSQVTNYLALARRLFRQFLLDRLRAATGSEDEFQQEVRQMFGGNRP
jgi:RNA polymerase sigma factor (sigma-70 family)